MTSIPTTAEAVNQPAIDQHRKRTEQLRGQLHKAQAHLARLPKPTATPDDPAYVNLKGHLGNLDRDIEKGVEVDRAKKAVEHLAAKLDQAERTTPVPLTVEDIKGARAVRDWSMWRPVRRVNQKTVTIESEYDVKLPFERIYGVKA